MWRAANKFILQPRVNVTHKITDILGIRGVDKQNKYPITLKVKWSCTYYKCIGTNLVNRVKIL